MKNILKRSLCLLTAILTLCASANAVAPQEVIEDSVITPRYTYIEMTDASLTIRGGLADCSAFVSTSSSSYDVELTMELQRNRSGWDTIKTWSNSGSWSASVDGNWYVTSGYDYRVKASVIIKNSRGSIIEDTTFYSNTESY